MICEMKARTLSQSQEMDEVWDSMAADYWVHYCYYVNRPKISFHDVNMYKPHSTPLATESSHEPVHIKR